MTDFLKQGTIEGTGTPEARALTPLNAPIREPVNRLLIGTSDAATSEPPPSGGDYVILFSGSYYYVDIGSLSSQGLAAYMDLMRSSNIKLYGL